jgi:CheY-like chemotaxis protein
VAQPAKRRRKAPEVVHLPLRRPRTLLVEDEFEALRRRRDLLRMKDLDVVSATSKPEALDRLRALGFKVDVVLTDLNLTPDGGAADAVDVAMEVASQSGRSVPIYAYSGKLRDLPAGSNELFRDMVLKTATSRRIREMFNRASEDAFRHFLVSVEQAEAVLTGLTAEGGHISSEDLSLIRDLVPGAAVEEGWWIPETVGFLQLTDQGVGVPYGISHYGKEGRRICASVIGHDYLYAYGRTAEESVDALRDVVLGFVNLFSEEPKSGDLEEDTVGVSQRLRELILALLTRQEELEGGG